MDMMKIGGFLQELRRGKGLTQEQLAEMTGVVRRTVSRWETGSNMPDLDILIELADFYDVDLREILNGERKSEKMNEDLKETVLQVADYSNEERARLLQRMHWFFIATLIGVAAPQVITMLKLESVLPYEFIKGFGSGAAVGVIFLGIIFTGKQASRIRDAKMRLLKKIRESRK